MSTSNLNTNDTRLKLKFNLLSFIAYLSIIIINYDYLNGL